jgi:Zn-ribbon RNA-binding protein
MMAQKLTDICSSCGTRLLGKATTSFMCPGCGEHALGRCQQCRDQSVHYKCEGCGFTGP